MKRFPFCLPFGLLGLLSLFAAQTQAWERIPITTNTRVELHFEVKLGPTTARPMAPWYAYFPVDPHMLPSPQTTPYPPWPMPFPPAAGTGAKQQGQSMNANVPRDGRVSQMWHNPNNFGMSVQPVSYYPAQAPSYWYRP